MTNRQTYTVRLTDDQVDEVRALLPAGTLRKRTRMPRENIDYAQASVRMIRGLARRASGDPDLLPGLAAMRDLIESLMVDSVAACRAEGYSWQDIAVRLGTTRQAVQQRYGRNVNSVSTAS